MTIAPGENASESMQVGGSVPSGTSYTVTNNAGRAILWSIESSGEPGLVEASEGGGELEDEQSVAVEFAFNPGVASGLAVGAYETTIDFLEDDVVTDTRTITLRVVAPGGRGRGRGRARRWE